MAALSVRYCLNTSGIASNGKGKKGPGKKGKDAKEKPKTAAELDMEMAKCTTHALDIILILTICFYRLACCWKRS